MLHHGLPEAPSRLGAVGPSDQRNQRKSCAFSLNLGLKRGQATFPNSQVRKINDLEAEKQPVPFPAPVEIAPGLDGLVHVSRLVLDRRVSHPEPGYFTGAMYVSYVLALPVMAVCVAAVYLVRPSLSFEASIAFAALLFLPFVPPLFPLFAHSLDPPRPDDRSVGAVLGRRGTRP